MEMQYAITNNGDDSVCPEPFLWINYDFINYTEPTTFKVTS